MAAPSINKTSVPRVKELDFSSITTPSTSPAPSPAADNFMSSFLGTFRDSSTVRTDPKPLKTIPITEAGPSDEDELDLDNVMTRIGLNVLGYRVANPRVKELGFSSITTSSAGDVIDSSFLDTFRVPSTDRTDPRPLKMVQITEARPSDEDELSLEDIMARIGLNILGLRVARKPV